MSNSYKIQCIILQRLIQGRFHSGTRHWAVTFRCRKKEKNIYIYKLLDYKTEKTKTEQYLEDPSLSSSVQNLVYIPFSLAVVTA